MGIRDRVAGGAIYRRVFVSAFCAAMLLVTTISQNAKAAPSQTDALTPTPLVINTHPVIIGCRRALNRLGIQYVTTNGTMGGCVCLAERFDNNLPSALHKPALEAFVLAVLARRTPLEDRSKIYKRFSALQERHQLPKDVYAQMISTTAQAINMCG